MYLRDPLLTRPTPPLQADVRRAYTLPVHGINITDPGTFWALENAWVTLRNACNTSMLLADQLSQTQATTINTSNTAVVAVSLSLFAIIALFIMVPAALRALRTQKVIFESLLEVPLPIIAALKDRAAAKIELARKEEDAAALGLDVDEVGDDALVGGAAPVFDDDERADITEKAGPATTTAASTGDALQAAINAAAQKRARLDGLAAAASFSRTATRFMCCTVRSTATGPNPHVSKPRHYRRAASSRNVVLVSLLWPVFVYCSYFVGMYFWRTQLVAFASYAKEEVRRRSTLVGWGCRWVTKALTAPSSRCFGRSRSSSTRDSSASISVLHTRTAPRRLWRRTSPAHPIQQISWFR